MTGIIIVLILILIILFTCIGIYVYFKHKVENFTNKYFGTKNIKEAFESTEKEASETPKSVQSLDSVYLSKINNDFPELNINELKSLAENSLLKVYKAIEEKDLSLLEKEPDKVKSWAESKIRDNKNKIVNYDSFKIHKNVVNFYQKNNGLSTIRFQIAYEYFYKEDNKVGKKVQARSIVEYIYIIDIEKINEETKSLGLHCPNCGAPIKSLGHKTCEYCGTGVIELVKKNWYLNNIIDD